MVSLLLRISIAFAFLYPPVAAFFNPDAWIGYFPPFLLDSGVSPLLLLHGFGVFEIVIAVWLLSGWKMRYPAFVAAGILLLVTAFNWSQIDIVFRDISLAGASLALAFLKR